MLIDYSSELERKAAAISERASLLDEDGKREAAKMLRQQAAELRREAARARARRTAWHPRRRLMGE
jgi:hypothetical protein